jgi:hypothetical protein
LKLIFVQLRDKELAIFNTNKEIKNELELLKIEDSDNSEFDKQLLEQKYNVFKYYQKFISSLGDDSKDIIKIIGSALNL